MTSTGTSRIQRLARNSAWALVLLAIVSCTKSTNQYSDIDTDSDSESATIGEPILLTGVDILFVVDNTSSMEAEHNFLASSMSTLINGISSQMGSRLQLPTDIRMAFTTTDMGVSYGGDYYKEEFSPHDVCSESPYGDNGKMKIEYIDINDWRYDGYNI